MLVVINSLDHPLAQMLSSDPVRPSIPIKFRVTDNCISFAQIVDQEVNAMICCAFRDSVPESQYQLLHAKPWAPSVAVFYTVWSFRSGAGRAIINSVREWIGINRPEINLFMTLSPPGSKVQQFHIGNGASIWRINSDSVNYQYL